MIAPRRFLPSISSLLALEAVDRLGTALAAAEELSLTHSAVSRQLKVLEEQLGVKIFVRDGKGLALTRVGATYAQSARDYLQDLARASLHLKASGTRDSINLAVLPAFGFHWLTPRVKLFIDRHPGININQTTRLSTLDFSLENFDAAIHFGARDWQGVHYLELSRERTIPVCRPGFAPDLPLTPERMLQMPLLHLQSRPGAWEQWFERHGHAAVNLRGMLFDQFVGLSAAAAAGLGISLLPEFVAEAGFRDGSLAPAYPDYLDSDGSYYLVWPKATQPSDALQKFIAWLRQTGRG